MHQRLVNQRAELHRLGREKRSVEVIRDGALKERDYYHRCLDDYAPRWAELEQERLFATEIARRRAIPISELATAPAVAAGK
jgi:hypothetical protein